VSAAIATSESARMSSTHKVIDIVVQSASIDLFAGHGVAIAPVSRHTLGTGGVRSYELVGLTQFSSPTLKDGILTLSAVVASGAGREGVCDAKTSVHR